MVMKRKGQNMKRFLVAWNAWLFCAIAAIATPEGSPFADGLTSEEAAPATGRDTDAPLKALVPPGLRLRLGMPQWRARFARPGLRRDGEGSRPGRPALSMCLPERDGGGDICAVFADGRLDAVFHAWSGEYSFTPENPGPARRDLRDALVRLGPPSLRRTLEVEDGFFHYWAWTKGDHALVFEFHHRTSPLPQLRPTISVERRGEEGEETLWNLAAGTFPVP
jgi:hypothetical protein